MGVKKMNLMNNKRAQITIFVILAILIVAAIILMFTLYKGPISENLAKKGQEPNVQISQCVGKHVDEASDKLIENGGYIGGYLNMSFKYKDVPYLCYTKENYARCIIQKPVLIEHLEKEIYDYIEPKIENCFVLLKEDFENRGYEIQMQDEMSFSVKLISQKAKVNINRKLEATKSDESRKFESFTSTAQTPVYDFAIIVQNIIEQEANYGNSDYVQIMRTNTWADIEKFQTGDDNTIYTITDTKTKKSWRFAVRGNVLNTPS